MTIQLGREIVRTCCAGVVVHFGMVMACSAGGGGEEPSDDARAHSPTRLDRAELGEEYAANAEEQAQPDGGARIPSLLVPVKEAKANASGARLKARYYVGADGSRQFLNWFDSELGVQCAFGDIGDGHLRCLPSTATAVQYADANCTQLVFSTITSTCGDTPATIGRVPYPDADGTCSPQYRYYEPGAKIAPATIYRRSGPGCAAFVPDAGQTYWFAGAELPVSSFVSGEIVTE